MFVQVITGKVVDEEGFRRQGERWDTDLRPGATGFLGGTTGVTDDGRFVATARFESAEAAQRNADRPEQGAWWQEMQKFVSDVAFHDSTHVLTIFGGGSDDATFVQVMRGRVTNRATLDALEPRREELERALQGFRPDVLGETIAYDEAGDGYTDIVYFTSEAEARENEKKEPTGEAKQLLEQIMSAISVDEYFDLRQPRLI
jgi:hypothetical protein